MVLACIRPCVNNDIGEKIKIKRKCSTNFRFKNNLKTLSRQSPISSEEKPFLLTVNSNEKMSILK